MTINTIPGAWLRDLAGITGETHPWSRLLLDEAARREAAADAPPPTADDLVERLRAFPSTVHSPHEAARREAVGFKPAMEALGCTFKDAPPPPADELVEGLPDTAEKVRIIGRHLALVGSDKLAVAAEECAAAIEALRAREKALEGVAEAAQAIERAVTDEFNEKGASGFAFARLSDLRNALDGLAAGGGNG